MDMACCCCWRYCYSIYDDKTKSTQLTQEAGFITYFSARDALQYDFRGDVNFQHVFGP